MFLRSAEWLHIVLGLSICPQTYALLCCKSYRVHFWYSCLLDQTLSNESQWLSLCDLDPGWCHWGRDRGGGEVHKCILSQCIDWWWLWGHSSFQVLIHTYRVHIVMEYTGSLDTLRFWIRQRVGVDVIVL